MDISRNTSITHGITHKNTSNTGIMRNTDSLEYFGYFDYNFQGELFE